MSSLLPPPLPNARPPVDPLAPPKFIGPMTKSVLAVCVVSALCWVAAVLVAAPLSSAEWLRELTHDSDLSWLAPSLRWLGAHAVGFCVAMLLVCLLGVAACWGMLYRQRWALWLFIVLLVVTALFNFVCSWVLDDGFRHLLDYLASDAASSEMRQLRGEMLVQRMTFLVTTVTSSIAFAGAHGWLAVRLLRTDVQAWFQR